MKTLLSSVSEGWGKVIFPVCLSVHTFGGGGYPSPRFFPGLWSQVLSGGIQSQVLSEVSGPRSFPRGTPVLAREYPSPSQWIPQDRGTLWPGHDWDTLLARTGTPLAPPKTDLLIVIFNWINFLWNIRLNLSKYASKNEIKTFVFVSIRSDEHPPAFVTIQSI